jgi:G:T-mismatch repair DNA endonuclease (very short patch repair protein)
MSKVHSNLSRLERERLIVDIIYGKGLVDSTIESYIKEELCAADLTKSINIVSLLSLMGIKRSHSAEKKTKRYKEKIEKTMLERYGVKNASQSPEIQQKKIKTIESKGKSYQDYLSGQIRKMKIGFEEYSNDHNRILETNEKIRTTMITKYGVENVAQIPEVRAKNSDRQKIKWSGMSYEDRLKMTEKARASVCSRGGYSSKPEKRVRKALIDLGVDFVTNVHIERYNFDIVMGSFIIEVQGDMWHAHPSKYKENDLIMGKILAKDIWEKDKRKRLAVESKGFVLIEIWEHEINACKTEESLLELVNKRMLDHGFYQ